MMRELGSVGVTPQVELLAITQSIKARRARRDGIGNRNLVDLFSEQYKLMRHILEERRATGGFPGIIVVFHRGRNEIMHEFSRNVFTMRDGGQMLATGYLQSATNEVGLDKINAI